MRKSLLMSMLILTLAISLIPYVQAEKKPSTIDTITYDWPMFWQTFKTYSAWVTEWDNGTAWVNHDSCMQIIRDYPEPKHCKITLNFTSQEQGNYRFTFAIDKRVKSYVEKISNYQYNLTYEELSVVFDWSDMKDISGLILTHGVQDGYFWFRIRRDNIPRDYNFPIDPSVIATSTGGAADHAVAYPNQRKTFYAKGLFWAFYGGVDAFYKTSSNGLTWSSETVIFTNDPFSVFGFHFSVWLHGSNIHIAYVEVGTLKYRLGTLASSGVISWVTTPQILNASATNLENERPFVCVDSNGYPWITWNYDNTTDGQWAYITKSSLKNGTWTDDSGFPYQLKSGGDYQSVVPLTGGKVYAIYDNSSIGTYLFGRLWSGSSWEAEEELFSSYANYGFQHSAVSIDDTVHLVGIVRDSGAYDIKYLKRTYGVGWGTEETLETNVGTTSPVLTKDETANNLYVFWLNYPTANHIYYTRNIGGSWDTERTDWITETNLENPEIGLTSFYEQSTGTIRYIGIMYLQGSSSPYNVKFAYHEIDIYDTSGVKWFMDRMTMWIGLGGLFVCMIAPIMAFLNAKDHDLDKAFLWLMSILIMGIPLLIAWLWG